LPRSSTHSKLAIWSQRFDRFNNNQQTVEQFCDSVGCSVATFYYWKHKLEADSRREPAEPQHKPSAFVPVVIRSGSATPVIIRLSDGTRVAVPVDALAALDVVLNHTQRAAR
jgi:hypothetical protein